MEWSYTARGRFVIFLGLTRDVALICLENSVWAFFATFSWLFRGPHFGQILRVLAVEKSYVLFCPFIFVSACASTLASTFVEFLVLGCCARSLVKTLLKSCCTTLART